jgi:hypothetical protein
VSRRANNFGFSIADFGFGESYFYKSQIQNQKLSIEDFENVQHNGKLHQLQTHQRPSSALAFEIFRTGTLDLSTMLADHDSQAGTHYCACR